MRSVLLQFGQRKYGPETKPSCATILRVLASGERVSAGDIRILLFISVGALSQNQFAKLRHTSFLGITHLFQSLLELWFDPDTQISPKTRTRCNIGNIS